VSRIGTAAMRSSIMFFVLVASVGCHQVPHANLADHPELLSAMDLAYVFAPSTSRGGFDYHSDGTPRGDSTVRIASVGMSAIEGGDWERGIRLTRAAYLRGLPDFNFYHDYIVAMRLARRPSDVLAACETIAKLWPADSAHGRICKPE
jgi:hypothetical protein